MTEPASEQHHVYIALCADGSLYTGYSKNVEQRLKTHNKGKGGRYTRAHRPLKLLASWSLQTKTEALRVEYAIKQLTRQQKLALAEGTQTFGWLSAALPKPGHEM
ncbi:GIY-YIG nuclease family protein [Stenomitos frigidus]|uniref:GIY-YIG domain-containing protein n=1 Tax=Stenomitos frigidus ULC18 TaxID=2107698 RepID=A0A2T1E6F3_9CYAN|nr:GIY-YIG nuclease family protein [Stenomitos frigidus]PSB28322.1 hypothetical protein C7B82_14075 [Stenomitos frigidus ULC18]